MNEHQLYELVAVYMQKHYPDVVYRFDLAADLKLTIGQASRHKRLHPVRGYPDLFIAHKSRRKGGLFIEIKKADTRLFKRDGSPASDHIEEQMFMLDRLNKAGYEAKFACGLEEIKQIIDEYLKNRE